MHRDWRRQRLNGQEGGLAKRLPGGVDAKVAEANAGLIARLLQQGFVDHELDEIAKGFAELAADEQRFADFVKPLLSS